MQTPPTSWPRPCRALASHASAAASAPRQLSRPSALPPPNTTTAACALLNANLQQRGDPKDRTVCFRPP